MSGGEPRGLIVDDDRAILKVLASQLAQDGIRTFEAQSAEQALTLLDSQPVDVVLTDLRMPGMGGMALLARISRSWPEVPVIVLTAHGSIQLAVETMKAGAADFIVKPFDREEVLFVVRKVFASAGRNQHSAPADKLSLLGESAAMAEVRDTIRRAAAGVATVLIRGETGTGKELVASAVHQQSRRSGKPFVKLNCAALPDSLLESELFGHEKGAFTGATSRKPGRMELAHGGTLFLDEIGDVPLLTQVKLLRILQEREFERVGGTETVKVDVRFIAATHRDLESLIQAGSFREDLFYRLNVVPLEVPPLRARPGDVLVLARHFAQVAAEANGRVGCALHPEASALLAAQAWPGNVRQLENFVERVIVLYDGPLVRREHVERELAREAAREHPARPSSPEARPRLDAQRRDAEREAVVEALSHANNNRSLAARLLGISRRTLYNKLEELGLS
ncbi:MAG: sigma-54 dependent transcriptional regulator [Polyangiaceae bacterium]